MIKIGEHFQYFIIVNFPKVRWPQMFNWFWIRVPGVYTKSGSNSDPNTRSRKFEQDFEQNV